MAIHQYLYAKDETVEGFIDVFRDESESLLSEILEVEGALTFGGVLDFDDEDG